MDFSYTDIQNKLYNSITAFALNELNNNVIERDKKQQFAQLEWEKCGLQKIHGLSVPMQYGGLGLDAISTAYALEALSYGCSDGGLVFSVAAQLLSCTIPINLYGSEEQKNLYLPLICSGKIVIANAMTELESGSDVFSLSTTAVKKNDAYIINGEKIFISNAPNSNYILLYASTDKEKAFFGGISAYLIDSSNDGIERSSAVDKMGLRSCLMGKLLFKNVETNQLNLLGKEGAGAVIFSESMNWERALLGAIHIGTMKRILNICLEYINSRKIKQEPIAKYQVLAHRMVDIHTLIETSSLLVYKAAYQIDHKTENIAISSSTSKLYTSDALNKVCDIALDVFGGSGYTTDLSIERYKRDAIAAKIYSGTNDIQKNIVSKLLGL